MKNIYEIPDQALCSDCELVKDSDEFAKVHFLIYREEPPVCRDCMAIRKSLHSYKSYETKIENEHFMKEQIFTILGYDLNRDIHEQFLERHPELQKK
jgi:hypothetical protein